jgi:putative redox protein
MKIQLELAPNGTHTVVKDEQGNTVNLYLPDSAGGTGTGVRPMQMLIMGLAGCAAVDILMILKKQRQTVTLFKVEIDAEREKDTEPALWQTAKVRYIFNQGIEPAKAQRAIELSMDKYCSVAETLRRAGAELVWSMEFE